MYQNYVCINILRHEWVNSGVQSWCFTLTKVVLSSQLAQSSEDGYKLRGSQCRNHGHQPLLVPLWPSCHREPVSPTQFLPNAKAVC